MAGIYVHIPFCHSKCNYCNFHVSTCITHKAEIIDAICRELYLQRDYLSEEAIETIYLGGGTPSILTTKEINNILQTIRDNFTIITDAEISLEANPHDLTTDKIAHLKNIGVNRISIGIQTFNEKLLKLLNRQDTIKDISICLDKIKQYDFENFNIDIIFAIFGQTIEDLTRDLDMLLKINPPHISAYMLNIEPQTLFGYYISKKILTEIDDADVAEMFLLVDKVLTSAGYMHYEISNFCKKNFESRHNFNYWRNKKYLGVGPSAHSYNLIERQWNVSNNIAYLKSINSGKIPTTKEMLTKENKINEYIFTHLRTVDGVDMAFLKNEYNYTLSVETLQKIAYDNFVVINNDNISLTSKGMLLLNTICSILFI